MINLLKRMAVILAVSAVAGTLLLTLVFCIPTQRMKQNVAKSTSEMIKKGEEIPNDAFSLYIWANRETFTDAIMVQNAIEKIEGKNKYEHAMWVYHSDLNPEVGSNWTPEESIKAYCNPENESPLFLHEYSRYWHGYLVYLKPLLLLFSWEQVCWMGVIVQVILMLAVLFCACRKKQYGVAVAAGAGFLFMKPVLVMISLTMSVCWVITLAALLFMLLKHEQINEKKRYPEVFLTIGILTAYFDFLTYPVVTLGLPLCAYFLLEKGQELKQSIQKIIGYSACWGIGYAGMWAMKWVIADITLQTGTIKDALWSIIGRTEAIGGRPRMNGGWYVIGLNLQEYPQICGIIAAVLVILVVVVVVTAITRSSVKEVLVKAIPFVIIACIPFAWIIVVQHHSALHARFTFRIIGVAITAFCALGTVALREIKEKNPKKMEKRQNI